MAYSGPAYWEVIYKAIADFGDVLTEAAKAKAALQSLSDSAKAEGDVEAAASAKAAAAHRVDTAAINEERRALEQLAAAAKLAQVWTAWGGRNSPEQHMSDLERELNLRTLINRQEWLGFTSPQQAYAWRQNELNQRKQMNYAEWAGYYTADQYLSYLQKQRSELSDLNAVLLRRADVYKANTDAALGYANALSGTHKSAGQLGENIDLSGVDQFQQALIGLPDVVSTKLELDDADAMARLAQYETLLRGVPHAETTVLTSSQVRGAAPVTGEPQAEVIPVSYGGPYQEQFARILAEIADLNRMRAEIPVEFHIDPTEVAALHVRLGQISVSDVITAHLASAGGGVGGGGGGPPPVAPGAAEPPDDAAAKWAALAAAEKEAGDAADADALKFAALHAAAAGDADAAAKLAYAYQALSASQKDAGDSGGAAAVSLLAAKAAAGGTAGALGQLAGGFIGAAQGWAALATRIALFGGFFSVALWHIIADAILEFVIALGGAIIGVAAMAAAVGIFIGVANLAQDTLGRISDRLKATYTAASATGQAIYPLANSFDKLARVIRPEVWQLYGDALTLVGGRMGLIGRIAESTGRTIDTLAARFTVWLNTPSVQQGFAHLIAAGLGFARQFGQIFKNLGDAILGFLKAAEMTHIAEDIGVVLIALTKLLDLVAHLPTPLLAAAFGLHALYLWGGLASTALLSLLDPLRAVAIAVGGLDVAESALGRLPADASALDKLKATVADIGAGFGALPGRITGTRTAIQQVSEVTGTAASDLAVFAANAEKTSGGVRALATSTEDGAALVEKYGTGLKGAAADAVNLAVAAGATEAQVARVATATEGAGASTGFFSGILARLGGLAGLATAGLGLLAAAAGFFAYKALTAKDNAQQWIDSMNKGLGSQSLFTVIGKTTSDLAAVTQQLAGSQHLSAQAAHELSGAQTDLSSKLQLELVHVGDISHAYGVSMPLALGLLNTAGVKTSALFSDQAKVWAAAQQQVAGLVKGYAAMGQGLTQLQGDVSVQLVMNSDQLKSMTTLNSAWDQWLATVTGGESTFVKAQQDFGAIVTAGKAAGASMTGLNANSLTLRSAFISMIPDAGKVQDAIRTQSAVLEDGAKGSALLTRATKDLAAEMIPLAGNSLAARASIIAVAEEADPAVNTWQKLTKWVGKEGAAGAANDLQSIMFKLVTPVSDLQKDAAKLTATLQQDLNPAMANAEFNALGGQKAFSTFASDLAKMGPNSQDTIQAGQKVASILLAIDKNSKTARDQFVAWAESMGLSRDKAEALWVSASKLGQTRYQLQIENNIQVTQGKIADLQKQLDSTTDPRKHRQIQLEINIEKQKLENFKEELRKLPTAQQVKIEITHYQADIADLEKKLAETTDPAKRHQIQLQISYDENKIKRLQGELGTAGQSADSIRKGLEQSAPAADRLGRSGLWAQLGDRFRTNMQEMGTWFTVTLPHAVESFGRFMAGSWSISYQQFFRDFASPLAKFFGTSVPDFFTQTIPHAAALAWDTAYQNFMRGFGSPVAKVFTSTLPGYFTSLWHGFLLDFGDPIGHFVTVTIPGFFANIGKFIGQDFSRWWSDNDKNWVTPLGRVFENLIPGWLIGSDKNFAGSASGWWKSFNGSYVQPAGHFFTTTMPSWLSDVGTFFAGSWNKSWAWFDAHIIGGFSRLWNNDFPSWLNDVLRFFESDWDKAWSWFSSHIIDGWSRLWNSTFPSWLNAVLRFFESTWDKAWSFFDHTLIGGWSHLFNSTFPSWLSSLGRFFSNTWQTVWRDFSNDVVGPMGRWFSSSLPNAIRTGFRDAVNWVIDNVINKVIGFIDNDILKHLPGSLHISTIGNVATGGDIGAPMRFATGSVPGASAVDGTHILAMGGEYMLRQPARMALEQNYGPNFLNTLNQADSWLGSGSRGTPASQATQTGVNTGPARALPFPSLQERASGGQIAAEAEHFIGAPYVFGGTSPAGWDCSGFVQYVLEHLGWHNVPRTSEQQYAWSHHTSNPAVGGLVFAQFPGDGPSPGHVGFYVGNGNVLSARDPQLGTGIDRLSSWGGHIVGYGSEPNATGLIGQIVSGIGGFITEAWQSVEGLLDSAGSGLGSLVKPLAGLVSGGAGELLKLAREGAAAIFNGVWDHSVTPLTGLVPGDTIPGALLQGSASEIKQAIDNFMTGQDSSAKSSAAASATSGGGAGVGPVSGPADQGPAQAMMYALGKMGAWGWGSGQFPPLRSLWNQESSWSRFARNPSSGAYGIPQALPASKLPGAGQAGGGSHASPQIDWGLGYIKGRYGSPAGAWAHEVSNNWYPFGGVVGGDGASMMAAGGLADWAPLNTAVRNEMSAFWSLMGAKLPSSATAAQKSTFGSWSKALQAQQAKTIGLGRTPPGAFQALTSNAANPAKMTGAQWSTFTGDLTQLLKEEEGTGIPGGVNPPGTPANSGNVAWKFLRSQWQGLLDRLRIANTQAGAAKTQWGSAYSLTPLGPAGTGQTGHDSPEWDTASAAMTTAVRSEMAAMAAMQAAHLPAGKTPTMAQRHAYTDWQKALWSQQLKTVGLGRTPPGAYQVLSDRLSAPGTITAGQWSAFTGDLSYLTREEEGTGISGGINPPGTPANSGYAPWKWLHPQWQTLLTSMRTAQTRAAAAHNIWGSLYGPAHLPFTPGPGSPPPASTMGGLVNVAPEATMGGPSSPVSGAHPDMGFNVIPVPQQIGKAAGGGLDQVASMFSGGMDPGGIMLPVVTRNGIPDSLLRQLSGNSGSSSREYPRTLSEAGGSHYGPALNVETMTINNPLPQRPSDSIAHAANRMSFLAGRMS